MNWQDVAKAFQEELEHISIEAMNQGHYGGRVHVSEAIWQALQHWILTQRPIRSATEVTGMKELRWRTPSGEITIYPTRELPRLKWVYQSSEVAGFIEPGELPKVREHNIMDLEDKFKGRFNQFNRQYMGDWGEPREPEEPKITFMDDLKDL